MTLKIIFAVPILLLTGIMTIIQIVWAFLIEIPWRIAGLAVDEIILSLDKGLNDKSKEKIASPNKSKFQQRLDDAIKVTKTERSKS